MAHPLTKYRETNGLTLDALAGRLGVHKTTLLRWEDGGIEISATRLLQIERETGIPREQLRPDLYEPRRVRARA